MKRSTTIFLQTVIVLFGVGTLVFLLWEPQVEGRNAHAMLFEIYFKDPFLAYAYFASIPFFAALYQAFRLLGHIERNEAFSQRSVRALRIIKYCAMVNIILIIVGVVFIMLGESDDRPPVFLIGGFAILFTVVIVAAVAVFERLIQSAVDIKSEHDLTV